MGKYLAWKENDELAFSGTITDPGHLQHQFLPTKIVSGDENLGYVSQQILDHSDNSDKLLKLVYTLNTSVIGMPAYNNSAPLSSQILDMNEEGFLINPSSWKAKNNITIKRSFNYSSDAKIR